MDLTLLNDAKYWINKNWYGLFIAYGIIFIVVYGTIWFFIEPMNLNDSDKIIFNQLLANRWGNHILLCCILTPHIALLLVAFSKIRIQNNNEKSRIVYDGNSPKKADFNVQYSQKWDIQQQQLVGELGKGEFNIENDVISIRRINQVGEMRTAIANYLVNGEKLTYIKKEITKHGNRNIQITGNIKLSEGGSQELIFVLKDYNTGDWIQSERRIVTGNNWLPLSIDFSPPFDIDFIIRIDSRVVINAPNSVEIQNLQVIEN